MDEKVALLNRFYTTIDRSQSKVETKKYGLDFIGTLKTGAICDYGELKDGIYKYHLSHIGNFNDFLAEHVRQNLNLCVYFNSQANNVFAFNLDCWKAGTNDVKVAALLLTQSLYRLNMPPLIISSGHGYHLWCRTAEPIENTLLRDFMLKLKDLTEWEVRTKGFEPDNVNLTYYPRMKSDISLRLFGSKHMHTGAFSNVTEIGIDDRLLDEDNSWSYFSFYLDNRVISTACFEKAYKSIDGFVEHH